ncbi:MAG: hypothetical protein Q4C48_10560 [Lachnospiraceae bacterium]|nr:hypothetical protein [Lachnospiraceae bacterium]
MQRKGKAVLLCVLLTFSLLLGTARADMGPKPSVQIGFSGSLDEPCYGTLLSAYDSTGPYSAWDGTEADARHNGNPEYSYCSWDYELWKAFADFEDEDGYYFLQLIWRCDETKKLEWSYHPPGEFKILLYFPESNTYAVSDSLEQYAFDSYFQVDLTDFEHASEAGGIAKLASVKRSYRFGWELTSLLVRIVLTILIELGLAVVFYGRGARRTLKLIAWVNAATQIGLNVFLNVMHFREGDLAFVLYYIPLEIFIFLAEAAVYSNTIPRFEEAKSGPGTAVAYAFFANAASFAAGMLLAVWIPGIF